MANWFCSSVKYAAVTQWAASHAYSVGDIARQLATPAAGSERVFRVTTAGTSSGTEPTWNTSKGVTTTDGTAVWTEITGSSTYNTASSWLAPFSRMRNLAAWMAAGDDGYFCDDHAATEAATATATFPGTLASPNRLFVVTAALGVSSGSAAETVTSNSNLTINGSFSVFGKFVVTGGTGGSAGSVATVNSTAGNRQYWDELDLILGNTLNSSSARLVLGGSGANTEVFVRVLRLKFAAASQVLDTFSKVRVFSGSIISGGTALTNLIRNSVSSVGQGMDALIENFDFSNFGTGFSFAVGGTSNVVGKAVFRNCKLPASWVGGAVTSAITSPSFRVELYNCDSGNTNYKYWSEDYAGSVKTETTVVMSGGSTDGTTTYSMKMTSSANCSYPLNVLRGPEIFKRNETTGGAKTLTLQAVHDSVTNLKESEFYIAFSALTTSGYPLGSYTNDSPGHPLNTDNDQASDSGQTWTTTGLTNPNKQKAAGTATPQVKGDFIAWPVLAKASKTLYVNYDIAVS